MTQTGTSMAQLVSLGMNERLHENDPSIYLNFLRLPFPFPCRFEFEEDIMGVFDNCETYNGTESSYTKMAFKLKKSSTHIVVLGQFYVMLENQELVRIARGLETPKKKDLKFTNQVRFFLFNLFN